MVSKLIKQIVFLFGVTQITTLHAFDCSVIYDEFDSLMHKDFLTTPENYVSAVSSELSFEDFNATQKGKFYLRKDRPERGIGVVFTNDKLYGKFIFHWPQAERLIFEDIIIYNRVEDGYAPFHHGSIELKPGQSIDLDMGNIYLAEAEGSDQIRADFSLSENSTNPILSSINEARVYFPMASLCDS